MSNHAMTVEKVLGEKNMTIDLSVIPKETVINRGGLTKMAH